MFEKKILEKEKKLEAREIMLRKAEEEMRSMPPPPPTIVPVPVPTPVAMPVKECSKALKPLSMNTLSTGVGMIGNAKAGSCANRLGGINDPGALVDKIASMQQLQDGLKNIEDVSPSMESEDISNGDSTDAQSIS